MKQKHTTPAINNVILVMSDSFRRDHIGACGNRWIRTPNLDRFAAAATDFPRFRMGSYATIPQRTDMVTGRYSFADRPWQALKPSDTTLAQLLSAADVATYCAADTPHLFHSGGLTFLRGFDGFHWSRGSEVEIWWTDYYNEHAYRPPTGHGRIRMSEKLDRLMWSQGERRVNEIDWATPQTFQTAIEWLTRNARRDRFFLSIDTFDPHEPWDPPQWLVDLYDPDYEGRPFTWAEYGAASQFGGREMRNLRARYAAECTFVDRWFGRLIDTVDLLGLADSTMIIFMSDHGHYLGYPNDGGQIGKAVGYRKRDGKWAVKDADVFMPLLDSVSNPPFFVRLPGSRIVKSCSALAQPVDVMPTILDALGVRMPDNLHGVSLMPLLRGKTVPFRSEAVTASYIDFAQLTTSRWLYGVWPHPGSARLFDHVADPLERRDVLAKNRATARKLHDKLIAEIRRLNAPADWIAALDAKRP